MSAAWIGHYGHEFDQMEAERRLAEEQERQEQEQYERMVWEDQQRQMEEEHYELQAYYAGCEAIERALFIEFEGHRRCGCSGCAPPGHYGHCGSCEAEPDFVGEGA